jgi:hypothetical protein
LICSERRLYECSNWLTTQIFTRKINIREEKLLLYHCLLELGLPKVSVSEQFYPNSSRGAVKQQDPEGERRPRGSRKKESSREAFTGGDHRAREEETQLAQNAAGGIRFCYETIPVYSRGTGCGLL